MVKQKLIDFRGERVSIAELARRYDINRQTLHARYNRGIRGDNLIVTEPLPNATNVTYYVKGQPYRMNREEKKRKQDIKVSSSEIQNRLNLGLSMDEALKYGRKYAAKFGSICYEVEGEGVFYYIPIEDVQELREHDISMVSVARNVLIVDDISELLLEDTKVFEEDYDYDASVGIKIGETRKKQKIQEYKDAKYRKEKPHLFNGTPQVHKWGTYAEYLASSYSFACSKVSE